MTNVELDWDPNRFRQSCLLHHLLCCTSAIQFDDQRCNWTGDLTKGSFFYDNGSGDAYIVVWEGERLMGLTFDHESDRSPYAAEEPDWEDEDWLFLKWLGDFPAALEPLFAQACPSLEAATAGVWCDGGKLTVDDDVEESLEHGLWMFDRHTVPAREAVMSGPTPWIETMSISPVQGELVLELLDRAAQLPWRLTKDEITKIMTVGFPIEESPICGVKQSQQMLRTAGFLWE